MDSVTIALTASSATLAVLSVVSAFRRLLPREPVRDFHLRIAPDVAIAGQEVEVILTGDVHPLTRVLDRATASLRRTHTFPVKYGKPGERFRSQVEIQAMTIIAEERELDSGALELRSFIRVPRDAEATGDKPLKGYDDPQSFRWEVEAHLELAGGARVHAPRVPLIVRPRAEPKASVRPPAS